jgi:hypothetical protein
MLNMDLISKSVSMLELVEFWGEFKSLVNDKIMSTTIFLFYHILFSFENINWEKKYTWQYKINLHYPLMIIMFYAISSQFNPLIYMTW